MVYRNGTELSRGRSARWRHRWHWHGHRIGPRGALVALRTCQRCGLAADEHSYVARRRTPLCPAGWSPAFAQGEAYARSLLARSRMMGASPPGPQDEARLAGKIPRIA